MTPPPPPVSEATWRNRFILINLTRIGGTLIVLVGLAIWHTDWIRPGGWLELGLAMSLVGLVISFWAPLALAKKWRAPPEQ